MRPYRGLTKEGKWVYGYYIEVDNRGFIFEAEKACLLIGFIYGYRIAYFTEVIPKTVGQQIGKLDVNGQELYFDDVVKVHYEDILGNKYEAVGVLDLDDCGIVIDFPQFGITLPISEFYTDEPDDFEKLGDIHSNPDLLKEDKE